MSQSSSSRRSCSSRNQLFAALCLLLLCSSFFVTAEDSSPLQINPQPRQLQNMEASDEGIIDEKDEAMAMEDDNLEEEYQFDDASLIEDHFDSKDFPTTPEEEDKATFNVPANAPDDMMYALGGADEEGGSVPDVVYDNFGMDLDNGPKDLPKDYDDTPVNPLPEGPKAVAVEAPPPDIAYDNIDAIAPGDPKKPVSGMPAELSEVESDGTGMIEEVDVEEKAKELLQEAEEEEEEGETTLASSSSSTKAVPIKTYSVDNQKKWVAHGAIGVTIFGLLVPSAISSAFFRDLIPGYWIYIHVVLNVTTFAMTFFSIGIAFATMNGMGDASEGHLKEVHHIVGLLLLLLVSFQTANGFLRPPREFVTDDLNDQTPGAIHRSQTKSLTTRTLWYLSHAGCGLLIFALGTYQVHSGMGLFSKRFGTTDWGSVYLGYIFALVILILGGKIWMKVRERKSKQLSFEMQMGNDFNYGDDSSASGLGSLTFRHV